MNPSSAYSYLRLCLVISLASGALVGFALAYRVGWLVGSSFAIGCLWGLANFTALGALLIASTRPGGSKLPILATGLVKLGVLGSGAVLLQKVEFSGLAFVFGVTWPLAVITLRSLGELRWHREGRQEPIPPRLET